MTKKKTPTKQLPVPVKKKTTVAKKAKPKKTNKLPSPSKDSKSTKANILDPHQCCYMTSLWSTMVRSMHILQGHYTGHQDKTLRGIYMPHIYELVSIIKPIHLAYPHFLPKENKDAYEWAVDMYDTWLKQMSHEYKEIT